MSAARWDRLVASLAAAGIEGTVSLSAYPGGTSRRIVLRGERGVVTVRDQSWRKNLDVWIGYSVDLEGPDAITVKVYPLTKKRSEVVANVRDALA